MKWNNVFCLTCIFLCATHSIEKLSAAEDVFEKANTLFADGYYFEAAIEYERIIFLSESPEVRVQSNLKKAESLKQLGSFGKARSDLQRSLNYRGNDSLRLEVLYQFAFCSFMAGFSFEAYATLLHLRNVFKEPHEHRIYLLESLVLTDLMHWEDLRNHLQNWMVNYAENESWTQKTLQAYDDILDKGLRALEIDPERAGILSTFLPGSGQFYAGEAGWGILNAFSQLASLAAFGVMVYNGYYIASFFAGLGPFQSFYFGGIRQAGDLATKNKNSRLNELQTALAQFFFEVEAGLLDY